MTEMNKRPLENPDGLGAADTALVGVSVTDAQKAQTERLNDSAPQKEGWLADVVASIVNGVSNVPDALATAIMAGVSPIHGLYATIFAPSVGGLLQSSQLTIIGVTVAAAVATGQALATIPTEQHITALATLSVMTGLCLVLFGVLKLGRLMKYISYPVMRGFLYGVGILLILNSIPDLVGYSASGANAFTSLINTIVNIGQWNWAAVFISVLTLAMIIIFQKTKLKLFASAISLVIASLLVYFTGLNMQIVLDISTIPQGLPNLVLPDVGMIGQLLPSSLSLAAIIAIQGIGVSQMTENPDESPISASRDMVAQGGANIASGLFAGLPVGSSIGSTALNLTLGARSRLSSILTGAWMIIIILFLPNYIEQVPMPALTALIIMAGLGAVNVNDMVSIMKSGWSARVGFIVTLLCVIFFSIPVALGVGIILSIIFNFVVSANDIDVTHLIQTDDGQFKVATMPEFIPSNDPMVITVEGNLFFAGAKTLEEKLPKVGDAERPVVIIRMRNSNQMGATLIDVFDRYADELEENGGKLYLSGLAPEQMALLEASGKLELGEDSHIYAEQETLLASTREAFEDAEAWVKDQQGRQRVEDL
ncbi:SulP family inorganic anion transporter [Aerococcaceae bacterium DSM 111020]|nr:SulP family inorganic anion transporter [Aerococcaceae bacterium DSM 111020]